MKSKKYLPKQYGNIYKSKHIPVTNYRFIECKISPNKTIIKLTAQKLKNGFKHTDSNKIKYSTSQIITTLQNRFGGKFNPITMEFKSRHVIPLTTILKIIKESFIK